MAEVHDKCLHFFYSIENVNENRASVKNKVLKSQGGNMPDGFALTSNPTRIITVEIKLYAVCHWLVLTGFN